MRFPPFFIPPPIVNRGDVMKKRTNVSKPTASAGGMDGGIPLASSVLQIPGRMAEGSQSAFNSVSLPEGVFGAHVVLDLIRRFDNEVIKNIACIPGTGGDWSKSVVMDDGAEVGYVNTEGSFLIRTSPQVPWKRIPASGSIEEEYAKLAESFKAGEGRTSYIKVAGTVDSRKVIYRYRPPSAPEYNIGGLSYRLQRGRPFVRIEGVWAPVPGSI
ncbi:Uncharacterised protein [uncultured archaeon]|nr:Uncharacterised protein [uncultured archaeon]